MLHTIKQGLNTMSVGLYKTLTEVSGRFFLVVLGSTGLSGEGNRVMPVRCQQK